MPKPTARSVPVITVKNISDRPASIKSKNGKTITIMPKRTARIAAHFASALPAGPIRKIA
jgi:hypothetical protein